MKMPNEEYQVFELIKLAQNAVLNIERPLNSIIYISTGSVDISNFAKERVMLYNGTQHLLSQGMTFQIRAREETALLICQFDITQHFTRTEIKQLIENSEQVNHSISGIPIHLQTFWSLIYLYIDGNIDMSDISQLLENQLFILLKKTYSLNELGAFFGSILGQDLQFTQFVKDNCLNVKSVEELAKQANYSTSGFIKKFQRCFNASPYNWIVKFKAKRIMQDIHYSQMSFSEIADKYSFGSCSYFYTFCKKHYNSTPLDLRKGRKYCKKENNDPERVII